MKASVWEYKSPDKQITYFRGYVKVYDGPKVTRVACDLVFKNKLKAKEDANKLLKKLKKQYESSKLS